MTTLADLLDALPSGMLHSVSGDPETLISAPVVERDDALEQGGVFVARAGRSVDGHTFIPRAVERGAAAIVGQHAWSALSVPYVRVRDAQAATGYLAAAYQGYPSRHLTVIGVTGTNGKTTTCTLLYRVLERATGGRAGLISTISADFGGQSLSTGLHVTTPSAPDVQAYLAQMRDADLSHVVLEMTSHGLAQGRLNGVEVDVAVLTNLTHEHLDYHGSFENYRAAKGLLFEMLGRSHRKADQPKIAVINADDPAYAFYAAFPADRVVGYSLHREATYRAQDVAYRPDGVHFSVGDLALAIKLVGAFNVSNALATVAVGRELGLPDAAIREGIASVTGIPGRMERIDEGQAFTALVDFAHTPDALEKALTAARTMIAPENRVIAVFGSAGLRDVEKRRLMAEVSARHADVTVLTAEDPRTESLDEILRMMAEGCVVQGGVEGETFFRVPDRGAAIFQACQMARPGDVVLACGKGHEQSMCFITTEYPWDDREAMRAALRGAPLNTLPTATGYQAM